MEAATSIVRGIGDVALHYEELIESLSERTVAILDDLEELIAQKAPASPVLSRLFAALLNRYPKMRYSELAEEEKRRVYVATQFATALSSILRSPILTKDVTEEGMALDSHWQDALERGHRLLRMED